MSKEEVWHDVGASEELARHAVQQVMVGGVRVALSFQNGVFGAIHGACNHAGGPLGKGSLEDDFVVCPWHQWKFHRVEGHGERGGDGVVNESEARRAVAAVERLLRDGVEAHDIAVLTPFVGQSARTERAECVQESLSWPALIAAPSAPLPSSSGTCRARTTGSPALIFTTVGAQGAGVPGADTTGPGKLDW